MQDAYPTIKPMAIGFLLNKIPKTKRNQPNKQQKQLQSPTTQIKMVWLEAGLSCHMVAYFHLITHATLSHWDKRRCLWVQLCSSLERNKEIQNKFSVMLKDFTLQKTCWKIQEMLNSKSPFVSSHSLFWKNRFGSFHSGRFRAILLKSPTTIWLQNPMRIFACQQKKSVL